MNKVHSVPLVMKLKLNSYRRLQRQPPGTRVLISLHPWGFFRFNILMAQGKATRSSVLVSRKVIAWREKILQRAQLVGPRETALMRLNHTGHWRLRVRINSASDGPEQWQRSLIPGSRRSIKSLPAGLCAAQLQKHLTIATRGNALVVQWVQSCSSLCTCNTSSTNSK